MNVGTGKISMLLLGGFLAISFFSPQNAFAAITYQTEGAIDYTLSTGATVDPAYPASIVSGDLLVLVVGMKPSSANGGSVTTPGGWTPITSLTGAGGYGTALAADTGNTNVFAFYKVSDGTETGNLSVSLTTNGTSFGQIYRFSNATGSWDVAGTTGSDTSGDTTVSITMGANPGVTSGDYILGTMVIPTDVTTPAQFSAEALTQTGITFGTVTEVIEPDTNVGNDLGGFVVRAPVSAGTASAAPVMTATAGGTVTNVRGPGVFIRVRETVIPTVTISKTAGAKIATRNSGDTSQYAHDTSCTGAASCAAFTLSLNTGSDTVTSVKITETGTVNASNDLSNLTLYYDTDGNWADGGAETQYGTVASFTSETATVSGSLAISVGTTYYFYVRFDVKSGTPTYPAGGTGIDFQIAANGDVVVSGGATLSGAPQTLTSAGSSCATTAQICVKPQVTGYANSIESGLNYSGGCTGCGARIGAGSTYRHAIVIDGYGFGSDPGLGSRDTSTNKVEIAGAATTMLADDASGNTNVSAWSNTQITIRTDTNITGNADTDFGTNFGDSAALRVTAGSQAAASDLPFYLFPQITSLSVPTGVADAAREYNAADTDGIITLIGTRFGTGPTGGYVRIFGCDSSTCSSPSGTVTAVADGTCDAADGWTNTCIKVQVPAVIATSTYLENIVVQQGTGSNNKPHTYTNFRILPRILSNTPANGIVGDTIQLLGDHFCQTGTCPVSPNRSSSADNVKFGSTQALDADFLSQTGGAGACNGSSAAWAHGEICVKVPSGTPTGSQPTVVTSNTTYTSNTLVFTRDSTVPSSPASLNQYLDDGTTAISVGGTGTSTVELAATTTGSVSVPTKLNVEVKTIGTTFDGVVTATSTSNCTGTCNNTQITVSGLSNGSNYHWRARVVNTNTYEASAWVAFGANPSGDGSTDGNPANIDFTVDTAGPSFTTGPCAVSPTASSCDASSPIDIQAQVRWITDESANEQIAWGTSCPSGQASAAATFSALTNKQPASPSGSGTPHAQVISGLTAATTYYYMARSSDPLSNVSYNPSSANTCNSFTTAAATTRIMKTSEFFIQQATSTSQTDAFPKTFDIFLAESNTSRNNVTFDSIILDIAGTVRGDGSGDITIGVNANGAGAVNYTLSDPGGGASVSWHIAHPVSSMNYDCPSCSDTSNTLDVTVTGATAGTVTRAKAIITYHYTP
jgi:hypothetical protein